METSDYKEKRKNEVAATKPRYVVLKILAVMALVYILGIFAPLIPLYPLPVIPSAVSVALWEFFTVIEGGWVFIGCGWVLFLWACLEPGFYRWRRVEYIIANMLLAGFIILMIVFTVMFGFKHETSITFNDHTYHVASQFDGDISTDYYLFICDPIGIICTEKKQFGNYVDLSDVQLRISEDGKAIEVITTAFYDGITKIFYTYTPETAGTE